MHAGEVVEDRFVIEAIAGTGGMGTVYRARDRATGALVALKTLRAAGDADAERFAREIRVLGSLRHPGIVRYIADGRTALGDLWLAMEWLEGENVSQRLARTGLTAAESLDLARRVAEALGAAHERAIVHRDVKPSNLMLPDGDLDRVKVLDFGVARITDGPRGSTRTGMVIGTPGYMAPEQVRGEREIGPRADVFAVGCVLFECLTGRPAFGGEHMMAILAKIVLDEAPRLRDVRPDLPEALDELVARTLAKQPEGRPASGVALAAELAALGTIESPASSPPASRNSALTITERRLLSVVMIASAEAETDRTLLGIAAPDTVITGALGPDAIEGLRAVARAHGATLEQLAGGAYVVTLAASGAAGDQVVQAARCALALAAAAPGAPIALATGRGVITGRWPVGEAIDRAARLLAAAPHHVRLDDVTAGLLDTRFEVSGDEAGLFLVGERDVTEVKRTLLGKPTPCVGRDRELGVLAGLFDECVAEPMARAVLVTGAAGVGKSRVRYELVKRLAERGGERVEVWIGRGDPLRAGTPYGLIAPALRRAAGIRDGEPLELRRHKLRARVMRNASTDLQRTTLFLGELVGAPFPDDESVELRAARQDPPLMVDQLHRAFEHFLAVETSAQPVVIVLEDLHWGDLPSIKVIESALRALGDRPWLVLALARPEVHELFPRLWADRGAQELRLDELTKKTSERLVRHVLAETGTAATETLVARIVEQAGGNAFYLEELIRAACEGKGDALPETVLAVVQSRLERLEVDARRVLRAASVFGPQFAAGGVSALLGNATNVRVWLDELALRELIARAPAPRISDEIEYLFRSALVREAAYAMLTENDKRLGHQLAADWLEHAGESEPMVLADHNARGGRPERALAHYHVAACSALAACDFATAVARAAYVVACGASGAALGRARLVQAEAHKWSGEFAEAAARGLEAMQLLPHASAAWFAAANEAAEASGRRSDLATLVALGEQLRDAPDGAPDTLTPRVTATAHAAFQLFQLGNYELAQVLLDRVEFATGAVADPATLARVYQARSSRAMFAGDAGAYLESEQAAANAFEDAGDLRYACMQRGHVGYACLEIGAYAEAERFLREAMESGARLGLANVVATAKHNLGRALMHRGQLAEALATETEALEMFQAQSDRRLECAARSYCGFILYELGDLVRAESELRLALADALPPIRPSLLANLARVLLATHRIAEARAAALEASAVLDELGGIEEGESLVRLMVVETLLANGERAAATDAARRARDRLAERAARITDPAYRASFTGAIEVHVQTIARARELGV